jgi:hypothetical protein
MQVPEGASLADLSVMAFAVSDDRPDYRLVRWRLSVGN